MRRYRPTYRPTAFIIHVPVPGFPREEEGEDHYQPTYRPTSRAPRIDPCARIACHVEIPKQCRSEDGETCTCHPADEPCPGEEHRGRKLLRGAA